LRHYFIMNQVDKSLDNLFGYIAIEEL
jgi:hypothetical protein